MACAYNHVPRVRGAAIRVAALEAELATLRSRTEKLPVRSTFPASLSVPFSASSPDAFPASFAAALAAPLNAPIQASSVQDPRNAAARTVSRKEFQLTARPETTLSAASMSAQTSAPSAALAEDLPAAALLITLPTSRTPVAGRQGTLASRAVERSNSSALELLAQTSVKSVESEHDWLVAVLGLGAGVPGPSGAGGARASGGGSVMSGDGASVGLRPPCLSADALTAGNNMPVLPAPASLLSGSSAKPWQANLSSVAAAAASTHAHAAGLSPAVAPAASAEAPKSAVPQVSLLSSSSSASACASSSAGAVSAAASGMYGSSSSTPRLSLTVEERALIEAYFAFRNKLRPMVDEESFRPALEDLLASEEPTLLLCEAPSGGASAAATAAVATAASAAASVTAPAPASVASALLAPRGQTGALLAATAELRNQAPVQLLLDVQRSRVLLATRACLHAMLAHMGLSTGAGELAAHHLARALHSLGPVVALPSQHALSALLLLSYTANCALDAEQARRMAALALRMSEDEPSAFSPATVSACRIIAAMTSVSPAVAAAAAAAPSPAAAAAAAIATLDVMLPWPASPGSDADASSRAVGDLGAFIHCHFRFGLVGVAPEDEGRFIALVEDFSERLSVWSPAYGQSAAARAAAAEVLFSARAGDPARATTANLRLAAMLCGPGGPIARHDFAIFTAAIVAVRALRVSTNLTPSEAALAHKTHALTLAWMQADLWDVLPILRSTVLSVMGEA